MIRVTEEMYRVIKDNSYTGRNVGIMYCDKHSYEDVKKKRERLFAEYPISEGYKLEFLSRRVL